MTNTEAPVVPYTPTAYEYDRLPTPNTGVLLLGTKEGAVPFMANPTTIAYMIAHLEAISAGYDDAGHGQFVSAYNDAVRQLGADQGCACEPDGRAAAFAKLMENTATFKEIYPEMAEVVDGIVERCQTMREFLEAKEPEPAGMPHGVPVAFRGEIKGTHAGGPEFIRVESPDGAVLMYHLHASGPAAEPDADGNYPMQVQLQEVDEHGVPRQIQIGCTLYDLVRMVEDAPFGKIETVEIPDGGEGGSADDEPADRDTADTQEYPDGIGGPCIDHTDVPDLAGRGEQ